MTWFQFIGGAAKVTGAFAVVAFLSAPRAAGFGPVALQAFAGATGALTAGALVWAAVVAVRGAEAAPEPRRFVLGAAVVMTGAYVAVRLLTLA